MTVLEFHIAGNENVVCRKDWHLCTAHALGEQISSMSRVVDKHVIHIHTPTGTKVNWRQGGEPIVLVSPYGLP